MIAGAFGAHGRFVGPDLASWQTAVLYTLLHAAVGMAAALALHRLGRLGRGACLCFTLGILGFSGSIFLRLIIGIEIGGIAPIGGSLLILGWFVLAGSGLRLR